MISARLDGNHRTKPEPVQTSVAPARPAGLLFSIQALVVTSLGGWLLLAPPVEGAMMLVPLSPGAAQILPSLALHDGVTLIATGPVPGSLLVYGRQASLSFRLLRHGILTIASPPGGCVAGAKA